MKYSVICQALIIFFWIQKIPHPLWAGWVNLTLFNILTLFKGNSIVWRYKKGEGRKNLRDQPLLGLSFIFFSGTSVRCARPCKMENEIRKEIYEGKGYENPTMKKKEVTFFSSTVFFGGGFDSDASIDWSHGKVGRFMNCDFSNYFEKVVKQNNLPYPVWIYTNTNKIKSYDINTFPCTDNTKASSNEQLVFFMRKWVSFTGPLKLRMWKSLSR